MNLFNFFGKKTFPKGIHPEGFKEETHDHQARRLPFPAQVILPLSQNIGKPSAPIVHVGQKVQRGEIIAKADGFMSVPLHSSVTGTVKKIDDFEQMSRKDLIQAVQNTGMVGLGGASFPTHVKMNIPDDCNIHTIIINGCECEPFLTTDHRIMLEQIEYLIRGIRIAMKSVDAPKAIIGVEDNKINVLEAIKPYLPDDGSISIEAVETKYPQGAEKMLVYSLLGKEIPSGKLPSTIGVAIFNVATLAAIGELLPYGQGLIERIVTITGDDLNKPGNYMVPIGTPLSHILEYSEFTGHEA
jgi:electron transport complex protein RnfC